LATLFNVASPAELETALAAPGLLLLDLYTQSCMICRRVEPMVAAVADASGGAVRACKVDAERHLDFAANHDVQGVPTLLLFRDGRLIGRRSGFVTASALREWIGTQQ
jgi:thioredoxin-like negative regulator of GroEL